MEWIKPLIIKEGKKYRSTVDSVSLGSVCTVEGVTRASGASLATKASTNGYKSYDEELWQ